MKGLEKIFIKLLVLYFLFLLLGLCSIGFVVGRLVKVSEGVSVDIPVKIEIEEAPQESATPLEEAEEERVEIVVQEEVKEVPVSPKGCSYWDGVIDSKVRNEQEAIWAKRVMRCESSCNERAYNPSGASGLFQIIPKWHPTMKDKVFDGTASIEYSLAKYRAGGAGLWVCK